MDSIKTLKGYGKVSQQIQQNEEQQQPRPKGRKRLIIMIVSGMFLLTTVIAGVIGAVRSNDSSSRSHPLETQSSSYSSPIKAACSLTLHATSCFQSLINETSNAAVVDLSDPTAIFKLSLQVAINEFNKISSLPSILAKNTNEKRIRSALEDCQDLFSDAVDNFKASMNSIQLKDGSEQLNSSIINDIRTYLSAILTDQETCLDGFEEMKSNEVRSQLVTGINKSREYISNSLAIVTHYVDLAKKLHVPMHRKLLGLDFPLWVSMKDGIFLSQP